MASKLFSLPLHQMRRNFGKCPNLRERLLMKRPFVWWGPICEGRSSGVGTRRPSKTQPRNCYCSQARWAKEFHCYQPKRAKQFNIHRNQIFKYDLIQSGVANCAALQSKLLCSFFSNWAGGPFITFIFKLIAPFYEMLAEFITELKNIVRLLFILPGTGLVWPVWLQYIPQRAIPYSAHTRRIKSALVEYTEKRPNKLFRWALNICNYLWLAERGSVMDELNDDSEIILGLCHSNGKLSSGEIQCLSFCKCDRRANSVELIVRDPGIGIRWG